MTGSATVREVPQVLLDEVVRSSLRPVAIGLGALEAVLALAHLVVLPAPLATTLAAVDISVAAILFVLQFVLARRSIPPSWAHPIGAFMATLILGASLLHLYLSAEPRQTTNVIFVAIGVGLFFLSIRWLTLVLAITLAAWTTIVQLLPPSPDWLHFGFALIIGIVLSVLAFVVRRQTFLRYERLRLQDEQHKHELQHRAGQLETSVAVGQHITSILDRDELLHQVAELIKARYGYYYVGIFLPDESGDYVRAHAGTGEAGRRLCEQGFRLRIGQEGVVGWVAAHGRSLRIDDVRQDSRYFYVEAVPDTRSELDLPLRIGDTLLGVLTLQSERLAAFAEDDVPFLQLLADQVAIAIYNASLYEGEKSARRLAEMLHNTGLALAGTLEWSEVLDLVLKHVGEIVTYDRAAVLVRRGSELAMVAARGFPADSEPAQIRIPIDQDESIFREIYQTQRPLSIPDVLERPDWQRVARLPQARAWLGVPLIHSDEVIGMLSLTRETPSAYHAPEIAQATAFAGQAAIALKNAQLYDKLARFNQQLEYEVRRRTEAVQEAYERLERLDRTKSDFISVASHELRTPLTVLRGYSQMMLKDRTIGEDERLHRLVSGIQAGALRLEEIVNSMLDMAKIDSRALQLYPEPVSIPALIQLLADDFSMALQERTQTLVIKDMGDMPAVEADPEALQKVFSHLIVNAIKYTPDGGTITISGGPQARRGLDFPSKAVEVVVADTGIGIHPDFHELIFTKFYQTGQIALHSTAKTAFKGGGPGLGLAIARGIIEAHRGKLWVESPGYNEESYPGSRFHVVLPVRQNRETVV